MLLNDQQPLFGDCPIEVAVSNLAQGGIEARGAIFTRREVVEFILDLVGYRVSLPLHQFRLLEPSFGAGDFLIPAVERLLAAYKAAGGSSAETDLLRAIQAVEVHEESIVHTGRALDAVLRAHGLSAAGAKTLRQAWLRQGDFLLTNIEADFDFVVGNPPYVRQELIADVLMAEYRRRYRTIFDRADLYIPFFERGLSLLTQGGVLGFICADRWMKNRYGKPLRAFIEGSFNLRAFVDMNGTPAFTSEVVAYPGIFVIAREETTSTKIARRPQIESASLAALASELAGDTPCQSVQVQRVVQENGAPWLVAEQAGVEIVRQIEANFPSLEEAGCKVGIGVATGADKAFIAPFDELDVEEDRKLPLVMTRDIATGEVRWRGRGIINPFRDDGRLVSLEDYPRLKRHLEAHKSAIAGRHVAKKAPANWYRTIDRIYPSLVKKPKLLIPDIKGEANIVLDRGHFYPHHNLYYVVSDAWDLNALQAVLLSKITRLFIATYSTRMRGGFLRFQAQYLRRLRLPPWEAVPEVVRAALVKAADSRDQSACDAAAMALYGLSEGQQTLLGDLEIA